MSIMLHLSTFALRGAGHAASAVTGAETASRAGDGVAGFLTRRFTDHSRRLERALDRAADRAWRAVEVALAGRSWWDRCKLSLAAPQERAFREQVHAFLAANPLDGVNKFGPDFRAQCLAQLQDARKAGVLKKGPLPPDQLARSVGDLSRFGDPLAVVEAQQRGMVGVAGLLREHGCDALATFLEVRPASGPPVLAAAVYFFFQREVETDAELFQGLAYARLEGLAQAQQAGFASLADALDAHGERLESLLADVHAVVVQTRGDVLDIKAEMQRHGQQMQELSNAVLRALQDRQSTIALPTGDNLSVRDEEERRLIVVPPVPVARVMEAQASPIEPARAIRPEPEVEDVLPAEPPPRPPLRRRIEERKEVARPRRRGGGLVLVVVVLVGGLGLAGGALVWFAVPRGPHPVPWPQTQVTNTDFPPVTQSRPGQASANPIQPAEFEAVLNELQKKPKPARLRELAGRLAVTSPTDKQKRKHSELQTARGLPTNPNPIQLAHLEANDDILQVSRALNPLLVRSDQRGDQKRAAQALQKWGTEDNVDSLIACLEVANETGGVNPRVELARALAAIGDERGVAPVAKRLEDSWDRMHGIIEALIAFGPKAEPEMIKMLQHKDAQVRDAARQVLQAIGKCPRGG